MKSFSSSFFFFFLGGGGAQLKLIYYLVLYTDLKAAEGNETFQTSLLFVLQDMLLKKTSIWHASKYICRDSV